MNAFNGHTFHGSKILRDESNIHQVNFREINVNVRPGLSLMKYFSFTFTKDYKFGQCVDTDYVTSPCKFR